MKWTDEPELWDARAVEWFDSVERRPASLTHRRLSVIRTWLGGFSGLAELARLREVHLMHHVDIHGIELVAASARPFEVLA